MTSFLDRANFLAIAAHLRGKQMSQADLAREMGVTASHIQRALREMLDNDLLRSSALPGRGTEYWVADDRISQLDRELSSAQPRWQIVPGQLGILIESITDRLRTAEILSSEDWTATILWGIETGAPGTGFLLVLSRDTTSAGFSRLVIALESSGCTVFPIQFGERHSAKGLRALATSVRDVADSALRRSL